MANSAFGEFDLEETAGGLTAPLTRRLQSPTLLLSIVEHLNSNL